MNRYHSQVRLLDSTDDVSDVGSSSSGYESNDIEMQSSDDEVFTTFPVQTIGTSRQTPKSRSTSEQVMMFSAKSDLTDSLALILEMPELCDVIFRVGKSGVLVHGVKAILATRSRCLYQLILHHQRKTEQDKTSKRKSKKALPGKLTIDVTDYRAEEFSKFIKFVHSGKVKVDIQSVVGLLCAAAEFGFRDLHAACLDFIQRCKELGQQEVLLEQAWRYQHKKAAQKLIAQLSTEPR